MHDVMDIIKNIEMIYNSNTSFQVLKDFERVLDSLDTYVFKNWEDGELVSGPVIDRHWVTCTFMWKHSNMPDPAGGKRLLDYDCKVKYKKSKLVVPRKIIKPDDMRPNTKKGKLDAIDVWLVEIQMPKRLITEIYNGFLDQIKDEIEKDFMINSDMQVTDDIQSEETAGGLDDMEDIGEI
jgi:hypothetical protein